MSKQHPNSIKDMPEPEEFKGFHQIEPRLRLEQFPPVDFHITTAQSAVTYIGKYYLNECPVERLVAIYLDSKMKPVNFCLINQGDTDLCHVSLRGIITPALLSGVRRIIILHNHPSGDIQFSEDDYNLARRCYDACRLMDCILLDSVVIGGAQNPNYLQFHSMAMEDDPKTPWFSDRSDIQVPPAFPIMKPVEPAFISADEEFL